MKQLNYPPTPQIGSCAVFTWIIIEHTAYTLAHIPLLWTGVSLLVRILDWFNSVGVDGSDLGVATDSVVWKYKWK